MRRSLIKSSTKKRERPITAADVGRYLRSLGTVSKDPHVGNPSMSEALFRLADVLIDAKSLPADVAVSKALDQGNLVFGDDPDFENLELGDVKRLLQDEEVSKPLLLILAVERLGMARSRLERMPREDIVRALEAAIQHEESLSIISEEARRGGEKRAS